MREPTAEELAQFYYRMAFSWDGQWFLKCKDRFGIETAMELNEAAVRSIGKIELRMLKALLGKETLDTCAELAHAYQLFNTPGFQTDVVSVSEDELVLRRSDCMLWREAVKAGFAPMGPGNAPGCRGFMRRMDGWSEVAGPRYGFKWEQRCSADGDRGTCEYRVTRYEKDEKHGA